jgi:NADH-quinone oxidoreductase subunit N
LDSLLNWQVLLSDYKLLSPELSLAVGLLVTVIFLILFPRGKWIAVWPMVAILASGYFNFWSLNISGYALNNMIASNPNITITKFAFLLSGLGLIILFLLSIRRSDDRFGFFLIIFSSLIFGVNAAAASSDLISVFVSLELVSFSIYAALNFSTQNGEGREFSVRFTLIGLLSSIFILLGFAFIFGLANTTIITDALVNMPLNHPLTYASVCLISIGLMAKLGMIPFFAYQQDAIGVSNSMIGVALSSLFLPSVALVFFKFAPGFYVLAGDYFMWGLVGTSGLTILMTGTLLFFQRSVRRVLSLVSTLIFFGILAIFATGITGILTPAYVLVIITSFNLSTIWIACGIVERNFPGLKLRDISGLIKTSPFFAVILVIQLLALSLMALFISNYFALYCTMHISLHILR